MSLIFQLSRRETELDSGSVRVQIWVSEASEELSPDVFVYQRLQNYPDGQNVLTEQTQFIHVADFADICSLDTVPPVDNMNYFRKSYIDLTFTDSALRQNTWSLIQSQIRELLKNISQRLNFPNISLTIEEVR